MNINPERVIGFNPNVVFSELYYAQNDIPDKNPLKAMLSRLNHRRAVIPEIAVIPEVAEMLKRKIANGTMVYGIASRQVSESGHQWLQDQLKKAEISPTDLHWISTGDTACESIADYIKKLGITDYYEGDKETILRLAALCPKVSFNLINHRMDHLSNQGLPANVWIIPSGALVAYPYNHF